MATGTISMIYCVHQATGTDIGVNEAIAGLPEKILPEELGGVRALEVIRALPGVIAAIDTARSDPDDLYVTTNTDGGRDNAIWPGAGRDVKMQADQSVAPRITVPFSGSQNISLWDYDSVSDDDLLGSVTMFESEQGQGEIAKLAKSTVESSYYYVVYKVD
jgi:hypothetical protein